MNITLAESTEIVYLATKQVVHFVHALYNKNKN